MPWRAEADVLAYFNSDWQVFAVRNALRLKALLGLALGRSPATLRR